MRKSLIVVLVVATCLPWFATTELWRNEKRRHTQSKQDFNEWLARRHETEAKSWWIMASYGLVDRQVRVTVGRVGVEFTGTRDWENIAQMDGPATVAALYSADGPEHVTVTVDGAVVFDDVLDPSAGPYIVIERNREKGFTVWQSRGMLYL